MSNADRPPLRRLEIVVPLAILGLMAVGLIAGGAVVVVLDQRMRLRFVATEGTVLSSSVGDTEIGRRASEVHASTQWTAAVTYTYKVDGAVHTGDRIRLTYRRSTNREAMEELAGRYRPGERVTVYYDPERPGLAVLDTTSQGWFGYLFAAVGGLLGAVVVVVVRAMTRSGSRPPPPEAAAT